MDFSTRHMATVQVTYANIDPKVRKMIMIGLIFAMLIACLDGTIVGVCGPKIAADLEGNSLYAWMITAYLLCETVMIPLSGKLSDLYGRKPLFLIGLTIFVFGSFAAGASTSMTMFIVCRAVQGVGGGILIPVATAAVADLYSPVERPKMQGALGAVFGIGSGIGPLIGGLLTESDMLGWRWAFYINIPLAIVAYVLTLKKFPAPEIDSKPIIDVKGMTVLSVMLLDLVLFFEFAGDEIAWISIESGAMIGLFIALMVVFVKIEQGALEPVLAPHLLQNRPIVIACIMMLIFGIAMMGSMTYASLFAITILIEDHSTITAGLYSLFMVAGMVITVNLSGKFLEKTGYRFWIIIGTVITAASMLLMSKMTMDTSLNYYAVCLFLLGAGLGCMMATIMVGVQNSSSEKEMGMSTSAVNLLRSIGATVGTAIFAMVISNKIGSELDKNLPADISAMLSHDTGILDDLQNQDLINRVTMKLMEDGVPLIDIPAALQELFNGVLLSFANSIDFGFVAGAVITLVIIVPAFFFKPKFYMEIPVSLTMEDGTVVQSDSYSGPNYASLENKVAEDSEETAEDSAEDDNSGQN